MTTRRDWTAARAKVEAENRCRVGGECDGPLEAAHTIGRKYDTYGYGKSAAIRWVKPDSVVPLCRKHHEQYDARRLDILPYLSVYEQVEAVRCVGLERARRRLTGQRDDV